MPKPNITIERIIAAVEDDDNEGICLECGADAFGIEPDARKYKCEVCGARSVYGAEELLMMYALALCLQYQRL